MTGDGINDALAIKKQILVSLSEPPLMLRNMLGYGFA